MQTSTKENRIGYARVKKWINLKNVTKDKEVYFIRIKKGDSVRKT